MSFWGGVSDAISSVAESIGNAISSIAEGIGNAISSIASGIGNVVSGIADGVSSFVESVASGVSNMVNGVGNWISNNLIDPIGDTLSGLFQGSRGADSLSEEEQAILAAISQAAYEESIENMSPEIREQFN